MISSFRATSMVGPALQVIRGRWFMVFGSFLIMSGAGATYIYGIYSSDIKSSMAYNQQTLNTLGFFKDLGANVGILSGLINELIPPWAVLAIGAAMNFTGYFMVWLAVTGRIAHPKVWQMCLYICIGANSQTFANTGALVTCVRNFPESRGIMIGLLKGYVGLSGAIFNQLYLTIYGHDSKSLILLIAWLPAALSIVFLGTIRIIKSIRQPNELKIFYSFLYIALALAGYLMLIIIIEKQVSFSAPEYGGSAAVVLFLLFLPLVIVVREELSIQKLKNQSTISVETKQEPSVSEISLPPPPIPPSPKLQPPTKQTRISRITDIFKSPKRGEDYTILQALVSVDMLIIFVVIVCGLGGTLTAVDNMGQIGESLGYPHLTIGTFVSLISIWNFGGRVAAGFASEILLSKHGFPRPLMLTLVLLVSCVGHILIAFPTPGSLYVASVIIGFCFGAQWPMIYAIISEIFGLKYYGTLYNFGALASPVGSYILNVKVAGRLYDREAMKQRAVVGGAITGKLTCIGPKCYRLSFIIITAVTFIGSLVSLVLVIRTREFYKSDIYSRFREVGQMGTGEMCAGRNVNGGGEKDEERASSRAMDGNKR
ncbi:protein NUCLEAR FUSION DEFECTIVE 4-like [Magnolia sinica]|uniref:protein NUCLEAR FUSION DEFECTIVE 4-like n=1 Tax=Magnolia sinica TaxID=86752 RepID=UPI002659465C|nr:protein NUCLEAR FUSION DEFECTIVE 4-like [Magnolia sinica]